MSDNPQIAELARIFILKMQDVLTAEEMAQVRQRNSNEKRPNVCHTHDFCDPNDQMAEAFEEVTGHEVNADLSGDSKLWGEAWNVAVRKGFSISGPADSWKAWDAQGWNAAVEAKLISMGMMDSTWHNDIAPSFSNQSETIRLWIGEADASERETAGWPRFNLSHQVDDFEDLASAEKFEWILPALEKALELESHSTLGHR